jgi:hypothetical protein
VGQSGGMIRLINVMPLTPAMLAEYVPPDFEAQQRKSAEEAPAIVDRPRSGTRVGERPPRRHLPGDSRTGECDQGVEHPRPRDQAARRRPHRSDDLSSAFETMAVPV